MPTTPTVPETTVTPPVQWAGDTVFALSPALRDVVLISAVDSAGDEIPNRWRNVAVIVAGDTVDSWETGPGELGFRLPNPAASGRATVEVALETQRFTAGDVEIVGNAYPIRSVRCEEARCNAAALQVGDHFNGSVSLGTARLLGYFSGFSEGTSVEGMAIASLDGPHPTVRWVPGLVEPYEFGGWPGLIAPGTAAAARQWIVDLSASEEAAQPAVWEFRPGLHPVGVLECLPGGLAGGYLVAELPSGDCLVLTNEGYGESGALTLNGVDPVGGYEDLPWTASAGCATLVGSSANRWTTLRRTADGQYCRPSDDATDLPPWMVLDASGSVAFSTPRYPQWVRGAGFAGDTLWVVGEAAGVWSLDAWALPAGNLLREVSLPGVVSCEDLLVDPARPYVYLACHYDEFPNWLALVVYDRDQGEVVARLDPLTPNSMRFVHAWSPITLVHGGTSGRIHVTAVSDGTTARVERGVFVATFDIR